MASIRPHKNGYRVEVCVRGQRDSQVLRTHREAKAWGSARETELLERAAKTPAELHTIREAFEKYRDEVSCHKEGARHEALRLNAFVRDFPRLAALTLAEFDTPHLAEWRDARLEKVQPASVNRDVNLIRNVFTKARKEWKWMEHKPFDGLDLPPDGPPRDRRIHPWKEVRPILRALGYVSGQEPRTKQQEVALAWLVGMRSCMRAAEILRLGSDTLSMKTGVARVKHKMQYVTKRPRVIPLPRRALRLLRVVQHREQCFTVDSASLDTLFRRARDSLMIQNLHFHDSRAEALTRLAREVDVLTLSKISGIRDVKLLLETYYRETPEQIAARIAKPAAASRRPAQ
ncbi:tyrosine-type recombinase/integrase [Candidimonas nitroreducens]|uniref:Integrase n=1 Tax=Candidimonas nitroreducens TaxID=683354 RepID=A0A225ML67_9BURK|nr:tyrosine-type recombinase/integrase [Candidimonas nitroreducens]OWT61984.1 integrase [Candidimonas nitroreducens]